MGATIYRIGQVLTAATIYRIGQVLMAQLFVRPTFIFVKNQSLFCDEYFITGMLLMCYFVAQRAIRCL